MKNLVCNDINEFKNYLEISKDADFALDLREFKVFDGLKFAVLSSAYFYQKHPKEKLKCYGGQIKNLISSFNVNNLEFI